MMDLDTYSLVLVVAGMAAVTFISRYPVLFLAGRFDLPAPLMDILRYVPPAVLISIILPAVLLQEDGLALSLHNEYLAAAIVTALVSWRTRRLFPTILSGMIALWLWRALLVIGGF